MFHYVKNRCKMALDELGYTEKEINLWVKPIGDLYIYHDFRSGKRHSYGYKNNKPVNIRNTSQYKIIKLLEFMNTLSTE